MNKLYTGEYIRGKSCFVRLEMKSLLWFPIVWKNNMIKKDIIKRFIWCLFASFLVRLLRFFWFFTLVLNEGHYLVKLLDAAEFLSFVLQPWAFLVDIMFPKLLLYQRDLLNLLLTTLIYFLAWSICVRLKKKIRK